MLVTYILFFWNPVTGRITVEELLTVIRWLDQNPTEQELHDIITEIDSDGNATIEFAEFLNLMTNKLQVRLSCRGLSICYYIHA